MSDAGSEPVEIRLYDTFTKQKQPLGKAPGEPVGVYVCGPTVYDRAHIGNARPAVVFDVLVRLLRHVQGVDAQGTSLVTYVRNITDVEDKIIARAARDGESIDALTERTTRWYHEDMGALGVLPPDIEPLATQHIDGMVAMIGQLIENGAAYAAEGHVLFSVTAFQSYGALSRRSVDDMIAGARVEVAPYKRDPMDFVLWKPSTAEEPGWDSPWGRGRPGWHIECSAMSKATLGLDFDIHGGGIDLAFPHHENERAQSLCAHPGSGFARIWMHNGFVQVEGQKMSKSLGNFITVQDLKDDVPGEVIRFAMLMTHYRQPFDWTARLATEARTVLEKWRRLTDGVEAAPRPPAAVLAALSDDLATPRAIAEMHALATAGDGPQLKAAGALLGLLTPDLGAWAAAPVLDDAGATAIDALLGARTAARKAKDFATADAIRDALSAAGVEVRDGKEGATATPGAGFDPAAVTAAAARFASA